MRDTKAQVFVTQIFVRYYVIIRLGTRRALEYYK